MLINPPPVNIRNYIKLNREKFIRITGLKKYVFDYLPEPGLSLSDVIGIH